MLKSLIDAVMCKRRNPSLAAPLPYKRVKREYECPICKGIISTDLVTECGHRFCSRCIEIHLDNTKKCPICRKDLTGSVLGPARSKVFGNRSFFRVSNGIKCPFNGMEVMVMSAEGDWMEGIVKMVIQNGDRFPLLLLAYGGKDVLRVETISQDSLRIRPKKEDICKEVKEKDN